MRAALWPLERLYALSMRARGSMYDASVLRASGAALPTLSVGNLTVGGTGKTPVAAWLARRLAGGARPAIVLRGYGGDEVAVHRALNPGIPVIAMPNRAAGVRLAQERGCDVVVLDDAFQHRRLVPTQSVLLVSAEQLERPRRLLPAGPWREPLTCARRADIAVITRKSASSMGADESVGALRRAAPAVPIAVVHLAPHALVSATDERTLPLSELRGKDVVAIAAIGEPDLFARQLDQLGARVHLVKFRDHYSFTNDDVRTLALNVRADAFAVCTLKDAVKLGHRWLGNSRLWYVSQRLVVEQGAEHIDRVLTRVLDARASGTSRAG